MPVITLTRARLAFGLAPLLHDAELVIEPRERIGLIGRNGCGKSSLLNVIAGTGALDDGVLWRAPGVAIACVAQEPSLDPDASVYDAVALGLGSAGTLLAEYHHAATRAAEAGADATALEQVGLLSARLDTTDGWALGHRVDTVLSRLGLAADRRVGELSGGWRKRVALAQALAAQPDLLLLDEPTNHLDFDAIIWLEDLLADFAGTVVFVTHDRRFLDNVATRIVELDRGTLRSYPGNFTAYRERKARELADEAIVSARADRLLAQEEIWIRKGVEARRTRDEGRVRRLERLRRERAERRDRLGQVTLRLDEGERGGKLVAELDQVTKGYGGRTLIDGFTTRILRGDRIGLIGPNGIGKTTLLKLILGEVEPDAGRIRRGVNLAVAYFDQMREALDPEWTLQEAVSPGSAFIEIGGTRRHVVGYLGEFLFAPERVLSPVRSLSGGERNRLLLARLFSQPANVLVLDEPTNDLDIDTLELLEGLLQDYAGTIFLVSHDRVFLDNVVTQSIVFEGNARLTEYPGGYTDWVAYATERAKREAAAAPASVPRREARPTPPAPPVRERERSLSFREERELAALPADIDAMEARLGDLHARLADPAAYRDGGDTARMLKDEAAALDAAIADAYRRWEDLEAQKTAAR